MPPSIVGSYSDVFNLILAAALLLAAADAPIVSTGAFTDTTLSADVT
ncbi:MAG: hypothetical protein IE886_08500, partial [Campylobacterales bacterium]|nr:hypothetical protein [Campylobacterales bacterium]